MSQNRSDLANQAADAIERSSARIKALVGFDGFVDSIIHIVDQRHSMSPGDYDRITTIPEFAARCAAASGKSANLEMVVQDVRFGGNGPLFSGALGSLGMSVTYIGAVGQEDDWGKLDPIYAPFAERCERVIPICPPGQTDAMEFDDGKIMLGKPANVQEVSWERIKGVVGLDTLIELFDQATLISVVNWTLVGGVEGVWEGMCNDVFPKLSPDPARRMFIDLSDPAKRKDGDIERALGKIQKLQQRLPVTLGLNLAESKRIASVLGVQVYQDSDQPLAALVPEAAVCIREAMGISCVVIHQHGGAGAADEHGDSCWFAGPYTKRPSISTGAGDHFGGGFSFAQCAGLGLGASLAVACGVAGVYVRDAESPSMDRLVEFLRDLPDPE